VEDVKKLVQKLLPRLRPILTQELVGTTLLNAACASTRQVSSTQSSTSCVLVNMAMCRTTQEVSRLAIYAVTE
jgi:hypothetical protein